MGDMKESYDSHDGITDQDELDMQKLGKLQQFHRGFDFLSILGFACVTMVTWEGILVTFIYSLTNGGPAGSLYGFIFVWIGYGFAIASLAEMMSMWPTSGGQYHWTYTLAPPKWAPFLSYICGWQSVIAWQAITPSATYFAATLIQGAAILANPTYDAKRWQGTLLIWAVMLIALSIGLFGNKMLPKLDSVALVLHIAGFIVVVATLGALSPTRATNQEVWETWNNNGYSSQGVSFLAGLQGIVFAWLGADGPIHMAEEIKNSSRVVPWSLMASILINGVLGFGILLAVLYLGPVGANLTDALGSPTGYPFLGIFLYATGNSTAATLGLASIVIIMAVLACLMVFTASTRELWAFARDKGLPGSSVVARVHKTSKLPLWCYAITTTVTTLLALINIGSSVAFNAIISLTIAGYFASYMFPISLILWRRIQAVRGKGPQLPWGPWRFGTYTGIVVNIIGLSFTIIIFIFSFFPEEPLPGLTVQTMNWSSLAYGVVTIFAVLFWLVHGKRTFKGPVRDAAGGEIEPVLGWEQGVEHRTAQT